MLPVIVNAIRLFYRMQPLFLGLFRSYYLPAMCHNDSGRAGGTPRSPGYNIIKLISQPVTRLQSGFCRSVTAAVGTGGDQRGVGSKAQCRDHRVGRNSDRECVATTRQPVGRRGRRRHDPGGWGNWLLGELLLLNGVGGDPFRQQFNIRGDKNKAGLPAAALDRKQAIYRRKIMRQATQAENTFSWVGDNAAGMQNACGFFNREDRCHVFPANLKHCVECEIPTPLSDLWPTGRCGRSTVAGLA